VKQLREFLASYRVLLAFRVDLRPQRWRLAGSGLLLLAITAVELLKPWPLQWVVDHALVPAPGETRSFVSVVWSGGVALLAIALLGSGLQYAQSILVAQTNQLVTRGLRSRLFGHLTRLGPRFHGEYKQGDLLVRVMGDAPMVSAVLTESSMELLARCLLIGGAAITLLGIDPLLALIVAAATPPLAWLTALSSKRLREAVEKNRKKEGYLADYVSETLGATALLQSFGREDDAAAKAGEMSRKSARTGLKAARLSARMSLSIELLLSTALAAALIAGAYRVSDGGLRTGQLLVFLSYVRGLLKPVRSASKHSDRIAKGIACANRVVEVLSAEPEVRNAADAVPAPAQAAVLRFEHVDYDYPDGTRALRGFDVEFRRGELVAIAGGSGAGKSTAAQLAVRLMDPLRGRVCLDDLDLRRLELASLRTIVALCAQDSLLFGATLRENLLLGKPDATDAELWEALERANAAGIVRALPSGLEEELGSAGSGLSGGEKRRIALARALLRDTPVLILDEPFAGLDRRSVERLCETLRSAGAGKIVLVIAHDLGNLDLFDRVVLIDAGAVVDEGSHAALSERSEVYRRVVRSALVPLAPAPEPAVEHSA
jgi:ABC-type multidrug transport system fused ATPase/permease subunit